MGDEEATQYKFDLVRRLEVDEIFLYYFLELQNPKRIIFTLIYVVKKASARLQKNAGYSNVKEDTSVR